MLLFIVGMYRHAVLWLVTYSSQRFRFSQWYYALLCSYSPASICWDQRKAGQQSKFFCYSLCLPISFSYAYIYTQCLHCMCVCAHVFRLNLEHMCSDICLLFGYSYNCIINCQLFYIYDHTYLSIYKYESSTDLTREQKRVR